MNFTIEVDDFWIEEEELEEALAAHIKRSVVSQISSSIKDSIEKQITQKVSEVIENKIASTIDNTLSELVCTGIITRNNKEITIKEHIESRFKDSSGWNTPNKHIDSIAKKFGEELKLQYNNAFANQIVVNMKKQGFLKNDVVKILLGDSSGE